MVMGNVSGRKEKSEDFDQEESNMKYGQAQISSSSSSSSSSSYRAHGASQFPMAFSPQDPIAPPQAPNQILQMQTADFNDKSTQYQENGIPTVFSWIRGGTEVAIEGSWDNWHSRELLEGLGGHFSIVKVLNVGVYHYRFLVDGWWTYAPDLPYECDHMGNVFNVLDLKENYPENPNSRQELECPSSPTSSYDNPTFTLDDFNEKLPEMPPLLQHTPLNQPFAAKNRQETLQKPLAANLNHLYIKSGGSNQPTIALCSSQRFGSKFVTTVLYKPLKKVRK